LEVNKVSRCRVPFHGVRHFDFLFIIFFGIFTTFKYKTEKSSLRAERPSAYEAAVLLGLA
jgi:hypothetical protein